ncbi:helix-turn-helix domain-containing protein [Anaerotignum sp.]|nr:XRE family transcriptional regulator [Anaerotignum sp.]MBQ7758162.1 helix-turn-helix transcriptional regulator [Anaerotignum sp.]
MNLNEIIATNLKRLRAERGLSLGKLSELSGVSKVMLSQIEKGESSPTINTLWKIASGLQVSYTKLIDEQIEVPSVIRKDESARVDHEGYRVYHYSTANPARDFEFFNGELDPHAEFTSEGHGVNTHEYVLVTKGEMILLYGGEEYILQEGDFVHFDCTQPHTYKNRGDSMTEFTNIVYYIG